MEHRWHILCSSGELSPKRTAIYALPLYSLSSGKGLINSASNNALTTAVLRAVRDRNSRRQSGISDE